MGTNNQVSAQPFGANPVDVTLSLGGALPCDWSLYDYRSTDQGKTWNHTKLAEGRDDAPFRIPSLADLVGHRLVWAIAAVYLDNDPMTVHVSITFRAAQGSPSPQTVVDPWSITAANPNASVGIDVT
jgi:hypothetical protein